MYFGSISVASLYILKCPENECALKINKSVFFLSSIQNIFDVIQGVSGVLSLFVVADRKINSNGKVPKHFWVRHIFWVLQVIEIACRWTACCKCTCDLEKQYMSLIGNFTLFRLLKKNTSAITNVFIYFNRIGSTFIEP